MDLEKKIEAILFWKGEPFSRKKLAEILESNQIEIDVAVEKLKGHLTHRGIVLLEQDNDITLGTAPEFSGLIEGLQKEELNKGLSKASLETLSIVFYGNGKTRAEIDYIRGVNSSFSLRVLSIRGLIQKTLDSKDNRRYIYKPSFEALSFLGIKSLSDLPEYEEIKNTINISSQNLDEIKEQ